MYTEECESIFSRLSATIGISAAAFGAHILKSKGIPPERVASWLMAANYMVWTPSESN